MLLDELKSYLNGKIAEDKAETGVKVWHTRVYHHAGNTDKGDAGDACAYHSEGYKIPRRLPFATEEDIVVAPWRSKSANAKEQQEIDYYYSDEHDCLVCSYEWFAISSCNKTTKPPNN